MISIATARKIALSMPQSEEREHHKHPDFRVCGKIFATLAPGRPISVVKLTLADQGALLQSFPEAFSLNGWSQHGWTNVHLKQVSTAQFRDLVRKAWRLVAPAKLHELLDR